MQYGFRDELAKRRAALKFPENMKVPFCEGVKTRGKKKEARIMGLTPIAENGCLYLRRYMRELENEMFQFPNGITMDIIDALAWQLPDHYPGDYEKKEEKPLARRHNVYSLETILKSVDKAGRSQHSFERQGDLVNRVRQHLEPVDRQ